MKDVSEFTKDQLQAYLLDNEDGVKYVDLDMRKGIDKLRVEVKRMQTKPVEVKEEPVKPKSTHIKNKETGLVFPYTKALEDHLKDRGLLCDEAGVAI